MIDPLSTDETFAGLRVELVAMAEWDRAVRAELEADGSLFDGYHPRMEAVHERNAARLFQIVERHGWPGRSLVGEEAARAAWIVLQHSIGNPTLQRLGLGWLREAAGRGEVPPVEVALLEDRIHFFEGKPQNYGTQFDWDDTGQMIPFMVDDAEAIDERRASVGLGPLEESIRLHRERMARGLEPAPRDWAERRREMEAWCRKVGWRP